MIPFATTQEGDRELIDLAFSKKKADERKEWLRQFRVFVRYSKKRPDSNVHLLARHLP